MAVELDEALNDWLKAVESLKLSRVEKETITGAGAEVFRSELEKETNEKHRSNHNDKVFGHMADHITYHKGNVDGMKNGKSTVGWDNAYHASNARRLNDGTKKYQADHFVDNLRGSDSTVEKVLLAEAALYKAKVKKAEERS